MLQKPTTDKSWYTLSPIAWQSWEERVLWSYKASLSEQLKDDNYSSISFQSHSSGGLAIFGEFFGLKLKAKRNTVHCLKYWEIKCTKWYLCQSCRCAIGNSWFISRVRMTPKCSKTKCKIKDRYSSWIHLTTCTKRKRTLYQGIESKSNQKNSFIRFSNLLHWSQPHKQHFHLLCPLSKAQLKSTTPFYTEACRLQVI